MSKKFSVVTIFFAAAFGGAVTPQSVIACNPRTANYRSESNPAPQFQPFVRVVSPTPILSPSRSSITMTTSVSAPDQVTVPVSTAKLGVVPTPAPAPETMRSIQPAADRSAVVQSVDNRPEIMAGSTVSARALFLGTEKGFVFLRMGSVTHRCRIQSWTAESTTFVIPSLEIEDEASARLELVRPNGDVVKKIEIRLFSESGVLEVVSPATNSTNPILQSEDLSVPTLKSASETPVRGAVNR